jgi:hypothetical protein
MNAPNIAVYAGGPLGPSEISQNLAATQQAGWTTIILGLFHIGRPDIKGQNYGDIIFNDSMTISQGKYVMDSSWPGNVATLKQAGHSSVTKIYASIGGGVGVQDFQTIQKIYQNNGNSFSGTMLETNLQLFCKTFPAIDGIDMDCEDNYDQASFVAFCELLIGLGFDITFCPYASWEMSFWTGSLAQIDKQHPGAVKWWNLQCYDGGSGNDPKDWAAAITQAIPGFSTNQFIVPGDWTEDSPSDVTTLFSTFTGEACLGGGFIWNMDGILSGSSKMADYVNAIKTAL